MLSLFATLSLILIAISSSDIDDILFAEVSCCPRHTSEKGCQSEFGSDCTWLQPLDPLVSIAMSQCVGVGYLACKTANGPKACCGCPGPNDFEAGPPAPPGSPPMPPPFCGVPANPNPPPPPPPPMGPVDAEVPSKCDAFWIQQALAPPDKCKLKNIKDCSQSHGMSHDWSTHQYQFLGVLPKNGACCYKYKSMKTSNKDCIGKNSDQSHIVLDIHCAEGDYDIVSAAPKAAYGTDGSTCFNGIKWDTGCSGECEYELCLNYRALADDVCPIGKGFILNKAGNAFALKSLNGVPSCHASEPYFLQSNRVQAVKQGLVASDSQSSLLILNHYQWIVAVLMLGLCGMAIYRRNAKSAQKKLDGYQTQENYGSIANDV